MLTNGADTEGLFCGVIMQSPGGPLLVTHRRSTLLWPRPRGAIGPTTRCSAYGLSFPAPSRKPSSRAADFFSYQVRTTCRAILWPRRRIDPFSRGSVASVANIPFISLVIAHYCALFLFPFQAQQLHIGSCDDEGSLVAISGPPTSPRNLVPSLHHSRWLLIDSHTTEDEVKSERLKGHTCRTHQI
ncbi:hypothetical protein FA95DRAFT_322084 [Auriscalpium vulgare]|uniref:Uncharacterized protein n=1 Tax=Auriscalpium vulgare TaxID=40419 RepID=A0ACB8S5L8_9AGAM|nr:hypothetical protein FA95DRAFT_322084 [Auriscalpium vulgare]